MQLNIAEEHVEIQGDAFDPYFESAGLHADAMQHLAVPLSKLPDEAVIFDVGANIGLSAIFMAIKKPRARIYAFEPGPRTYQHLVANTAAFANVTPVAAALSHEPGALQFHVPTNGATAHVVGSGHMEGADTIAVPCLRLDDFAAECSLEPDFIKIDVEGHEPEVIAGAAALIARSRPAILMEFNAWTLMALAGHSPAAFATALFRCFEVEGKDSAKGMLYDNLLKDGCVTDLALRLRPGHAVPSLADMSYPPAARLEIAELRRRLDERERGFA